MDLSVTPLDYLKAFLGGVGVSFTPCVYPLIPVIIGFIGVRSSGSKVKGFILSLVYVSGLAVTYAILGIIASLTGTFFGKINTSPATYITVGAVIIIFGFSMLDIFRFPVPKTAKLTLFQEHAYLSTFFLGVSTGLVASPCLTPVLGSILVYLAATKNVFYGASMLFVFAYGMGFVLILAGTFSAVLTNLPRSGKWLAYVKKTCALLLLGMGLYFVFAGIKEIMI